jgi:RNA polymerase sigma-70 factor, ECF subfamily
MDSANLLTLGNSNSLAGVQDDAMTGGEEDEPLIAACRAGHSQAFEVLVRRYQDRLYSTLFRLTGSAEDARDLLQEAFFRAYRKLDRYEGGSSFYTWLYRLTVNLAISWSRKRKSRPLLRLSDLHIEGSTDASEPLDQTDPSLPLEIAERNVLIHKALTQLADDHREVVLMKDFDGLRYEEIASLLEIPIGTVRSRLHRARNELRLKLRDVLDLDPDHESSVEPGWNARSLARNGTGACPSTESTTH